MCVAMRYDPDGASLHDGTLASIVFLRPRRLAAPRAHDPVRSQQLVTLFVFSDALCARGMNHTIPVARMSQLLVSLFVS